MGVRFMARQPPVQILQAIDLDLVEVIERLAGRQGRGQRRVVGDAPVHRLAADRVGLADGLLALGGVDDQVDLVVLDHVDDVRAALAHLVDAAAGDAGVASSACAVPSVATKLEAVLDQLAAPAPRRRGLSRSRTLMKHTPLRGSVTPEAVCALA